MTINIDKEAIEKLLSLTLLFVLSVIFVVALTKDDRKSLSTQSKNSQTLPNVSKTLSDIDIIQSLNNERNKVGSPPLSYNANLVSAASAKAKDTIANKDFTPGNSSQIGKYVTSNGYSFAGSSLFVYPEKSPMNGDEFVNLSLALDQNKKMLLDSSYKDVGIGLLPVNSDGISNVVVLILAKPQIQPTDTHSVPVPKTLFTPTPNSIHCSSYYIGTTAYTNCYNQ